MGDAFLMIELLVIGVVVLGLLALILTRGRQHIVKPMAEPLPTLPPVLLPEPAEVRAQDISALRFSVGLRGYRTDQVDQVLDHLQTVLDQRDEQIAQLQQRLETTQHDEHSS